MNTTIEFAQQGQFKPLEDMGHLIGRRIEYQGEVGLVKYCGPLKHDDKHPDANQPWLGVQWDNAQRGKHNGTVEGYTYFSCDDGMNSGTLLKLEKANFGTDVFDAIHFRYFNTPGKGIAGSVNSKGESIEYDEEVYFETVKKFKKKVEFVGFNKIWQKINDLKNLRELSLPGCKVSDIGPDGALGKVLPNLRNLSLEGNLLYDWNQVFLLGRELKNLSELSISGNKLHEPEVDDVRALKEIKVNNNHSKIQEVPSNVFRNLNTIVLISMDLTWKTLNKVLPMFFNVSSLVLCDNQLNDFENLTYTGADFKQLEFLNLEKNQIKLFEGIKKFKDAPKLAKLTLSMNEMRDLGEFTGFNSVTTVIMEDNNITDFSIFSHFNQFPKLETLRFTKNPISKKYNPLHTRQRAIAEIKNLKNINGGELKKYERKDSEIYYLRNTFHEFFDKSKQTAFDYDFADFEKFCKTDHPRIPELIKKYGNPYDESVKNKPKDQPAKPVMASLTKVQLNAFSGPYLGKPAVTKKFTDNTLITNLKAMLAKQFNIPATKQKIYCKADPKDPFVLMDEDLKDLKFYGVKDGHEIWVGDTEL